MLTMTTISLALVLLGLLAARKIREVRRAARGMQADIAPPARETPRQSAPRLFYPPVEAPSNALMRPPAEEISQATDRIMPVRPQMQRRLAQKLRESRV